VTISRCRCRTRTTTPARRPEIPCHPLFRKDGSRVPRPPPKIWRHISVAGGYGSHESDCRISAAARSMANPVAFAVLLMPTLTHGGADAPHERTIEHKACVWDDSMAGLAGRIRGRRGDAGDGAPSWSASASPAGRPRRFAAIWHRTRSEPNRTCWTVGLGSLSRALNPLFFVSAQQC
jgi:hypothetical protein